MAYSDKNVTTRQEEVRAAESGAPLRRNPARAEADVAGAGKALTQPEADAAELDELSEGEPVQSRRARRRASEQAMNGAKPVRRAEAGRAGGAADDYEDETDERAAEDELEEPDDSRGGDALRWLKRGARRLRSRASDERADDGEMDEYGEGYGDSEYEDEEETPTRRRLSRSPHRTQLQSPLEEYEDEEETPTRRRLSRSPHRASLRPADEERPDEQLEYEDDEYAKAEYEDDEYEDGGYAGEDYEGGADYEDAEYEEDGYDEGERRRAARGARRGRAGGRDLSEDEDGEAGGVRRGLRRLFRRGGERARDGRYRDAREYEDEEEYDGHEPAPRNRFMAWLESMRIVEEVPEDEYMDDGAYGGDGDEYEYDGDEAEREPRDGRRGNVPVPQGRQRRGEAERAGRQDSAAAGRSSARHSDEGEYAREEQEDRTSRRGAVKAGHRAANRSVVEAEDRAPARRGAAEADERATARRDAAEESEHECADRRAAEAGEREADVREEANARSGGMAESSAADGSEASGEEGADAELRVSRRARRAQPEAGQEPVSAAGESQTGAGAVDSALTAEYMAADLPGKRRILLDFWREQFPLRMLIPAKPEKLKALEDMVRQILDECPDEDSLNRRWAKISKLLDQCSSAVVAEYVYKALVESVHSEEQKRMYGRPSADKSEHEVEVKPASSDASAEKAEPSPQPLSADHAKPVAALPEIEPAEQPSRAEANPAPKRATGSEPRSEAARQPSPGGYDDVDSREGEYTSGARRPARDYGDYDFEDSRRRSGGVSRFLEKMHTREGDGHDAVEGAKGWIKQLFRRGEVLDYSIDEPADSDGYQEEEQEGARTESRRDGRASEKREGAAAQNRSKPEPARQNVERDAESGGQPKADEGASGGARASDGYSGSSYSRSESQQYARPSDGGYSGSSYSRSEQQQQYARPSDGSYTRSESQQQYARPSDGGYSGGGYSRSEQQQQYARPSDGGYSGSSYSRSESQQQYARPSDGSYSGGSYTRSESQQQYARPSDGGYSGSGYSRSESQQYARPSDGGYSGGGYSRSEQQQQYARPSDGGYSGGGYSRSESQQYETASYDHTPFDYSVYDRNSEDYSADRPDYSQDFADNDYMPGGYSQRDYSSSGYSGSGYSGGSYSGTGYSRSGSYAPNYARANPAGGAYREYGEREYHSRPQTGRPAQSGEDAEDRWRRCTPTKDDRGGMGAPQGDAEDGRAGMALRLNRAGRILSSLAFATACAAEEGEERDGSQADEPNEQAAPPAQQGARRRAGLRLGGRGLRRRWMMALGALALIAGVMLAAYGLRIVYDVKRYDGAFYEGIYLDGIALEGMTLEEAEQAVAAANVERLEAISLKVSYDGELYQLDSAGLGVELDAQARLSELWRLGREGGYAQRYAQIAQLREQGVREYTSYSYNKAALDEFLSGIKADVDRAPRDAQIAFHPNQSDKFDITPSAAGREVDITALSADAQAALAEGGGTVELAPKPLEPEFTTEQARACTGKLVTYSTEIRSSNAARTSNVRLALGFYNGLVVQPGQSVDFNQLVGNRTQARGFKPAPEYSNGEIVEGIGGGVCQASTTLYGALLRAGMRIDERYSHSMTVGYVPLSQDAAVVYPGKTLAFTNTTGYPAFFATSVTSDRASVTIYGYDVYPGKSVSIVSETISVDKAQIKTYSDPNFQYTSAPGEEVMVTSPSDGATSRAYRVLIDDETGKEISREALGRDTYRRRDGVVYRGGQ